MVDGTVWKKIWGEELSKPLKWNRGGVDFGVVGLTNGKTVGNKGFSCSWKLGKFKVKYGDQREEDKLSEGWDYEGVTKIALIAQKDQTLVFSNNPKEDELKETSTKSAASIMFCIGGPSEGNWKHESNLKSWLNQGLGSKYYRKNGEKGGDLLCGGNVGGNPYESTNRKITDGKKLN